MRFFPIISPCFLKANLLYLSKNRAVLWIRKLHDLDANTGPDPVFHYDPKPDPDPTFQFHADFQFNIDPDPDPNTHFFPDLDPPMLQNNPLRLPPFHFEIYYSKPFSMKESLCKVLLRYNKKFWKKLAGIWPSVCLENKEKQPYFQQCYLLTF